MKEGNEKAAILRLAEAEREIAGLKEENERLRQEAAKLRGIIRSKSQEAMSSRLKDALRE